jgi:hypothetical protein
MIRTQANSEHDLLIRRNSLRTIYEITVHPCVENTLDRQRSYRRQHSPQQLRSSFKRKGGLQLSNTAAVTEKCVQFDSHVGSIEKFSVHHLRLTF